MFPYSNFYSARDGGVVDTLGKGSATELYQPLAIEQIHCMAEESLFFLPLVNKGALSFTSREFLSKLSDFTTLRTKPKITASIQKREEGILLPSHAGGQSFQ